MLLFPFIPSSLILLLITGTSYSNISIDEFMNMIMNLLTNDNCYTLIADTAAPWPNGNALLSILLHWIKIFKELQ